MKKGVIYYTRVREEYAGEHLDHMIPEQRGNTASHFFPGVRRSIIMSVIQEIT